MGPWPGHDGREDRIREISNAFSLDSNRRDYGNPKEIGEFPDIDRDSLFCGQVHLVEGKDHGAFELGELEGEEQVPFKG